jgi:uncharacterized protein (DUF302 family)
MLVKLSTDKTVSEAAAALQTAVQDNHFGVMQVHNLKETMTKKGVEFARECLIFEVCQPQQAKKVLDQNMSVSTALPCRISIYEEDGKTILATLKPTTLLAMFNTPQLKGVAREPTAVVTTQTVGPYQFKVLGESTHLRMGDNAIRIEVTDATGKPVDAGSVWLELRMDMPGMAMQATAQLEKGQNPGVFNGTIRPTGQGEWHASIGYENKRGKNSANFTTGVGP